MSVWTSSDNDRPVTAFRAPVAKAEEEMMMEDGVSDALVVSSLRRLLADAITFYLRAHGFHWNVVGSDFSEYHALFESIYSDVYESVDPIAENIRKLDGIAPFRLPELMALRSLTDQPIASPLPAMMVADLLAGNEQMLMCLNDCFHTANAANQQGIANFVAERIDQHMKWSWQLKSSLAAS